MSPAFTIGLILLAFVALLLLRQVYFNRRVPHYTIEEVVRKLKFGIPLIFLDVRTAGENRQGHIPGSINIPLHDLSVRLPELDEYRRHVIVVYCDRGRRSVIATHHLQKNGFNAVNLRGGMNAWQAVHNP
jgi:rhodanese-related sulfurtransferase